MRKGRKERKPSLRGIDFILVIIFDPLRVTKLIIYQNEASDESNKACVFSHDKYCFKPKKRPGKMCLGLQSFTSFWTLFVLFVILLFLSEVGLSAYCLIFKGWFWVFKVNSYYQNLLIYCDYLVNFYSILWIRVIAKFHKFNSYDCFYVSISLMLLLVFCRVKLSPTIIFQCFWSRS